MTANGNRVVTFMGPMKIELQTFDYPKLVTPTGNKANHGAILKIVTTNIRGSDQRIYHGRFARRSAMGRGPSSRPARRMAGV